MKSICANCLTKRPCPCDKRLIGYEFKSAKKAKEFMDILNSLKEDGGEKV